MQGPPQEASQLFIYEAVNCGDFKSWPLEVDCLGLNPGSATH